MGNKIFCNQCSLATERNSRGRCKPCANAANAAWRLANPEKAKMAIAIWGKKNTEKLNIASAKWRTRNPEKAKSSTINYRINNPEKVKATQQAYYKKNRKQIVANSSAWCKANPELNRIRGHNRRVKERENGGVLSKNIAAKLYALQKGMCPCCNQLLGDKYNLDHIMPIVLGGSNTDDNIQLLRARCNNQKYAKHPIDFMQSRGFLL